MICRANTNIFRTSPKRLVVPYISSSAEDIPLFMQSPCHYCDTVHLAFKDLKECHRRYHRPVPPSSETSAVYLAETMVGADIAATTHDSDLQDAIGSAVDLTHGKASNVASHQAPKTPRRTQKREKWASIKDEVHQRYVIQGMTLEKTMVAVEYKYSFKAR